MFPLLYNELSIGEMNTLKSSIIQYPHVKVYAPTTDLESSLLKMMCVDAAEVFERQAGREYGFGNNGDKPARATVSVE